MTSSNDFENVELTKVMTEVSSLTSARRHGEAAALCTATIERSPEHAELYFRRGMIRHVLKELQPAIEDVSRAIELRKAEPAYRFFRGLWRLDLGVHDDAIVDLSEAIRLEEALDSSYYVDSARLARSVAYMLSGDLDQALMSTSGLPNEAEVYVAKRVWSTSTLKQEVTRRRSKE